LGKAGREGGKKVFEPLFSDRQLLAGLGASIEEGQNILEIALVQGRERAGFLQGKGKIEQSNP